MRLGSVRLGGLLLAALLLAAGCSTDESPAIVDDSFLAITDCGELERLASEEVDRISSTTDRGIVEAATARFEAIVAHRDSLC